MEKIIFLIRDYWADVLKIGFVGAISLRILHAGTKLMGRWLGRYVKLEFDQFEERIVNKVVSKIEEKFKNDKN